MNVIQEVKEEIREEMLEKENDRGVLDIVTEKAVSRKFLVWLTSSALLYFGKINSDEWVAISLGYVGIQGFADLAVKWKGAKNEQS